MAELIDKSAGGQERYDSECPECGSENVWRSNTYDLSEISSTSPWCEDCGYGWMESV